ncbi:hypothetical protein EZV62_008543 [Acer yangbiense]|uniref:F-box domain-containing protein n=1 Tax=Acer yangbiense TaxID=1000413 RepID=A0A5C7IDY9_9ROSI|nr:hypothetical protein EZV62_008543 [Acer yangbiense]
MGETTTIDSMDRLTELPLFIIHHIMSRLSAKEAAQTSILSKRWKALYTSFPVLDFHEPYTYFMGEDKFFRNPAIFIPDHLTKKFRKNLRKFIKFVDTSLVQFCELEISMQKFRLLIGLLDVKRWSSVLDRWLGLVVENRVKELNFEVQTSRQTMYTLSQTIYFAKSITSLKLSGCKLELPCDEIRLYALKSLSLDKVCITEEMLQKLMSRCSLLEDLHLSCLALKHIYVSKLHKLKIISIRESPDELQKVRSVEIVVPSLEQFSLDCNGSILIDMVECPNLMVLELSRVLFTEHEFHVLISNFPLLEDLSVNSCDLLERITISSNLLKNLSICFCDNLKAIDIDALNLLSFSYCHNPIPVCSMNAPCPWKVELGTDEVDLDTQWYIKIKEFLAGSNQIEDVILTLTSKKKHSFNFDECRESSPSFPRVIGNLDVGIYEQSEHYAVLLDGLLEVCYPRTLTVFLDKDSSFIEWLFEKLMNVDASCCDSHDIKCWRHYLKDFKIGGFLMSHPEDQKPLCLDNFSLDNLKDALPRYRFRTVRFHLNWGFPEFYK